MSNYKTLSRSSWLLESIYSKRWVASAKSSYEEAEQDLALMMGIKIGQSSLHRLVQKSDFPQADSKQKVDSLSVDGGKIRLRTEKPGSCQWRDYIATLNHFGNGSDARSLWSAVSEAMPQALHLARYLYVKLI